MCNFVWISNSYVAFIYILLIILVQYNLSTSTFSNLQIRHVLILLCIKMILFMSSCYFRTKISLPTLKQRNFWKTLRAFYYTLLFTLNEQEELKANLIWFLVLILISFPFFFTLHFHFIMRYLHRKIASYFFCLSTLS